MVYAVILNYYITSFYLLPRQSNPTGELDVKEIARFPGIIDFLFTVQT